jgi:hypothetical protein
VGAVAGVTGAAAAVYPLFNTEQHFAHLSLDDDVFLGSNRTLTVKALSDPIVVTGSWYLKHGSWWNATVLQADALSGPKDKSVAPGEQAFFYLDEAVMRDWIAPSKCPPKGGHCRRARIVEMCAEERGQIEVGIELKSKNGAVWARRRLPYCVRQEDPPA